MCEEQQKKLLSCFHSADPSETETSLILPIQRWFTEQLDFSDDGHVGSSITL